MRELIRDITLCIATAWCLGLIAQQFRQPVLLAYLISGFLLGPVGSGLIASAESISTIADLGLIFLLFMIGLEIDLKKIISAGRSITLTALVQNRCRRSAWRSLFPAPRFRARRREMGSALPR